MRQLNYPISMRIINVNSLSSIFFWLTPRCIMRSGESNSDSNNSAKLKPKSQIFEDVNQGLLWGLFMKKRDQKISRYCTFKAY